MQVGFISTKNEPVPSINRMHELSEYSVGEQIDDPCLARPPYEVRAKSDLTSDTAAKLV